MTEIQAAKASGGRLKLVAFGIAVLALFVVGRALPLAEYLDRMQQWLTDLGPAGPLAFICIYVVLTVLAFPGSPLSIVAGALFGGLWGTIYISIASTAGAALAFLLARYVARDSIAAWLGEKPQFQRLERLTARRGAAVVAMTRLVPIFPFNLLNYGFGLTSVPFVTYAFWSWLCMLPGTALSVVGVDAVVTAVRQGNVPWHLIAAVTALFVVLVVVGRYAKHKLAGME